MPVDAIETPTEALRQTIIEAFCVISAKVSRLNVLLEKNDVTHAFKMAKSVKTDMIEFVELCSFNPGFEKSIAKNLFDMPRVINGNSAVRRRYALSMIKRWKHVSSIVRKQKLIVLPNE
ncbi:MAG: hypothetical protein ACOX7D_03675 [Alphaproteobacteria bacterium]|jgi:hypothetical protein